MKTALIIVSVICVGLVILLTIQLGKHEQKFDHALLIGTWKVEDDYQKLNLKADNTFELYIGGSRQNLNGTWDLKDIYNRTDTTSLLVLKNERKKEYEREEYFNFYFFKVDKVEKDIIKLTDLSATRVRRNKSYTFER